MLQPRIAITGSTGFCGQHILQAFLAQKMNVLELTRQRSKRTDTEHAFFDLDQPDGLPSKALKGVTTLIHTAAFVHQKGKNIPTELYERRNVTATRTLFEKSATAGVKHFIFLSTVGIYGKMSASTPICVDHPADPQTPYASSKLVSEQYLIQAGQAHGITVSIIRLPLIYGPFAPGNFGLITKIASKPLPLPFGGQPNRRSMVSVHNVGNFMTTVTAQPQIYDGVVLYTDGSVFSTADIISAVRKKSHRPPWLFALPRGMIRLALHSLGRPGLYAQLYEDLEFKLSHPAPNISLKSPDDPAYFL